MRSATTIPQQKSPHILAANLVAALHVFVIVFFVVGWILPWTWAWWTIIIGGFALQGIWFVFANRCPLTLLEEYFRTGCVSSDSVLLETIGKIPARRVQQPQGDTHFVATLLSKATGRPVSSYAGDIFVYAFLYTSMGISAIRLM